MQKKIIIYLLTLNEINLIFAVYNEKNCFFLSKVPEENNSILLNEENSSVLLDEEKKVSQLNEKENKLEKLLNPENFKMPIFLQPTIIITENFINKFQTK